MSEKFSETSIQRNNVLIKGMNLDLNESYVDEQSWTYALNATNASEKGDVYILGNEPSNKMIAAAPYPIIGTIDISLKETLLFSTDDTDSEIGVFDKLKKTYVTKINDRGLGFKRTHLVRGVIKTASDGVSKVVYFCDNLNPDRALNLNKIPYKKTGVNLSADQDCDVPEYSTDLDTEAIRLTPYYSTPCISVKRGKGSGQIPNGSYQAVIAYSENGSRLTDYSIPGNPLSVWNHTGVGNSVEIRLDGLDRSFDQYELVVISTNNQQTVAKKIGNYSTSQSIVPLDTISAALPTVPLSIIPLRSPVYEKSAKMFNVNNYLIRTDLTAVENFNYQPQANKIRSRWVAVEYPADYYRAGENVGYLRDEVYSYFIRWVHKSGQRFASFHIPGRAAETSDLEVLSSSPDIVGSEQQRWQIYDTSTRIAADEPLPDGGRVIAKGEMGYHQSTEKYSDKRPDIWGELCGKPIRHHKMPSNETIHIHSQGGDKIIVLGVEFDHIEYPRLPDGSPVSDIVGYEILRGSREGNRSVIAKGLFNNMFEYQLQGTTSKKGVYQNYPYNDLNPDKFLVKNRSWLNKERLNTVKINSEPGLDTYRKDLLSFHSPDTTFQKPYMSAPHVKLYTEQQCSITGGFELPYNHPGHKILTDATLGSAALIGISMTLASVMGQMNSNTEATAKVGFLGTGIEGTTGVGRVSGLGSIFGDIGANLVNVSGLAGTLTAAVMLSTQSAILLYQSMDTFMDLAYKMTAFKKFELQYNSHGFYDKFAPVRNSAAGNKPTIRRAVPDGRAKYVGNGIQDFDSTLRINNLNRNPYVAVQLESEVPDPTSLRERSRIALRDKPAGLNHENPFGTFTSQGVSYYGALKIDFENQYGQLESVIQIPISSCVFGISKRSRASTGVLFGGDIYINRYTEKNPYMFFRNWLVDVPDGTEIDYTNYVNGPIPRYWADFNKYGMDDFKLEINLFKGKKKKEMERELKKLEGVTDDGKLFDITTPSDFHKLDRGSNTGVFALKNSWFYLFCNGTRDFFVESEINLAFRDYGEEDHEKFYDPFGEILTDLSTIYRSDKIKLPTQHRYDFSLSSSKLYNNFASWGAVLPDDYDPAQGKYFPKRAIYSLPNQEGLKRDNWRNFLGANYKDFSDRINQIRSINETGALILFENSQPVEFVGQDTLQTDGGIKFTVGDSGLFQQQFQSLVNGDSSLNIGSCQSFYSSVNTPFGLFWTNMKSGEVYRYAGKVEELGILGIGKWLNKNLKSRLLEVYPDYPAFDNPVLAIGCTTSYDQVDKLVYFSKKDYIPLRNDLEYDEFGRFYLDRNGLKIPIEITDKRYFKSSSFTVSFDPKENKWISFHSWIPDLPLSSFDHFYTIKKGNIWKHNDRIDSFCNFYGKNHPFKVESVVQTPGTVTTLRNVEYFLEVMEYPDENNRVHILDENFDEAIIHNTEQISGTLKLIDKPKNNPVALLTYPKVNNGLIEVLVSKEEHRYRFNQFWDAVKDRGEFSLAKTPLLEYKPDGHDRIVNTEAIDLKKPVTQRKKFRHYLNRILLVKNISGSRKYLLKLVNTKQLFSSR